ncbi:OmpA family protein [Paraburkholderia sartisoli]|uniref:OmpA family protein n=1 Tax=Paraburkholderia sartisoli TaxID=83784 RepID=A0A1H4HH62_9BURK|nr:OmpA family protein [Paraburkholderia sartisoli]SEB21153.1 OmpA family protein [Paraburkholderia sartisoli]
MSELHLGYPFRAMVVFTASLALALLLLVLPVGRGLASPVAAGVVVVTLAAVVLRTLQRNRARAQNAHVMASLGATTASLPVSLRTRMPLMLVTGDSLPELFNRDGDGERVAHVGNGAIWLRVDNPGDLPHVGVAVKRWRDGRAPDGVVLSIAPAAHASDDALAQALRIARQAASDASRMLGARLPGYVAIYQRLTTSPAAAVDSQWYGVSSACRLTEALQGDAQRLEAVMRAAETQAQQAGSDPVPAARAAALASIIGWTQRAVIGPLTDPRQPAMPWPLWGTGWIDCGPASDFRSPWARDIHAHSRITPPPVAASPVPWPLPQPLIEAMPRRLWVSPRLTAVAHAIALLAFAGALAIWGSAGNNQALLSRAGADLDRFSTIPVAHDNARRNALQALVADRDQIDRYARLGVPLRLSFGMYRGDAVMPVLDTAISSYEAPPPPPAVVTLDSMSLFDSGKAQLRPGSTRALVGALEMIRVHPDRRILVAGYTDNIGNADSNLKLSIARAGAVRDWLVEASGIPVTQFAIQGYGDTRPIASNATVAGRAKNRRVEITLVPNAPKEVPLGGAPKEVPLEDSPGI